MPLPTNPNLYQDVARVLDTAVARGGANFVCKTRAEAVRWRLRANKLRKLLNEERGFSPYDNYSFGLEDCTVKISPREITGTLIDEHGKQIEIADAVDEDWETAAKEARRELGLDVKEDE